jgi:hypothetical protein
VWLACQCQVTMWEIFVRFNLHICQFLPEYSVSLFKRQYH